MKAASAYSDLSDSGFSESKSKGSVSHLPLSIARIHGTSGPKLSSIGISWVSYLWRTGYILPLSAQDKLKRLGGSGTPAWLLDGE